MENRFENFSISVMKLNKIVQRIKLYEMEEYGLRAIHVMCIYYLDRAPWGLTSGELVKATCEDKAAISRALGLLRKKGYIEYDSRKYNSPVKITQSGKKVADYINERANAAVEAGGDNLTEARRDAFYETMKRISENLESYYKELRAERKKSK